MLRIRLRQALLGPCIATADGIPASVEDGVLRWSGNAVPLAPGCIESVSEEGGAVLAAFKGGAAPVLLRLYAPAPVPEMTWEVFKTVPEDEWEGVVEDGSATDGTHLACDSSPYGIARLAAALERGAYRAYCDCTPLCCARSLSFGRWRRKLESTQRAPGLVAMARRMGLDTAYRALSDRGFLAFAEGGSVQMAMLTALRRHPEEQPWGFEVVRYGRFTLAEFA